MALLTSFWSENKGGGRPPGHSPGYTTGIMSPDTKFLCTYSPPLDVVSFAEAFPSQNLQDVFVEGFLFEHLTINSINMYVFLRTHSIYCTFCCVTDVHFQP